ncbi:MAG: fumarate reductase subunit C [Succinivibrio sp.]|nr:fumarate reductase subunit C [Succinivibrio sp.]
MSEAKSFRKPYKRPVDKLWWLKNKFFTVYMIREGTAVTALFAALEIILGIFLFGLCNLDAETATAETAAPYLWWVQDFLGNPLVIILNLVCLAASLFHAVTWFNLMPKAVRLFMNKNSTELLPDYIVKMGLYGALAGATVVILVFAVATI